MKRSIIKFWYLGMACCLLPFLSAVAATSCDNYTGSANSACVNFCVTHDCLNNPNTNACENDKRKFIAETGETRLPCEPIPCSCWPNGTSDLTAIFLPLGENEVYLTCLGIQGNPASIIVEDSVTGERKRQVFARNSTTIGNFCRVEYVNPAAPPIHHDGLSDEELSNCISDISAFCATQGF